MLYDFQIPGGRLAEIFGSKYIFGLSILFSGIFNLLIPLVANENPVGIIVLRILLGLAEVGSSDFHRSRDSEC